MQLLRHTVLAALVGVAATVTGSAAAVRADGTGAVTVATAVVAAHVRAPVRYVALGDSYSSGVGAEAHIAGSGHCDRSSRSYPALWAAAHRPASFGFAACSGAQIADVADHQLAALSPATTLVSITVGGNDEGFAAVMQDCVLRGTSRCVSEVHARAADMRSNLGAELLALFAAIGARAPRAQVVVLGYPRFYDVGSGCLGLSSTSRRAIDAGIDLLDSVLHSSARSSGFRFADVRAGFAGHEICDGTAWLHAISLFHITESYHPTAHGQAGGYYPAFESATAAHGG